MTAFVYTLILVICLVGPLVLCWFDPAGKDPNHDFREVVKHPIRSLK